LTWEARWCLRPFPCSRQLPGQVVTRQEARQVLSRLAQPPRSGCLDRFCGATTLSDLAGRGLCSRECVHQVYTRCTLSAGSSRSALLSVAAMPRRAGRRDSIVSNDAGFSLFSPRCLTGEVYPLSDLARRANERALRKNSPVDSWFSFLSVQAGLEPAWWNNLDLAHKGRHDIPRMRFGIF